MQCVKFILFPSSVGRLLKDKVLSICDLDNVEKLSSILSEVSVNKIMYLNQGCTPISSSTTTPSSDCKTTDLFRLDIFNSYVDNNSFGENYKPQTPVYTVGSILNALTEIGDEEVVPSLEKMLHNYHLGFTVHRIKPKTYGVVFQPLCEVNSPDERLSKYLKDMEGLLSDLSLELNDGEMLAEDIFQHYLSLM